MFEDLTCSTSGGSPAPRVEWHRLGEAGAALEVVREVTGPETRAVLQIRPTRQDRGAEFLCRVWNRAMGDRQRLEERARLRVKCKSQLYSLHSTYTASENSVQE